MVYYILLKGALCICCHDLQLNTTEIMKIFLGLAAFSPQLQGVAFISTFISPREAVMNAVVIAQGVDFCRADTPCNTCSLPQGIVCSGYIM